jgi:hypothetical protein
MNREDLLTVADDLNYLKQWGPTISDGDIRRGSAILRRLLVEDAYGQAWRSIGRPKQPGLIAVDISSLATLPDVVFALAQGADFRGLHFAGMLLNKGSVPIGNLSAPLRAHGYPGEKEFTLSAFLVSPSGMIEGRAFSRRDVIKYIANVKGGVHLSANQRTAEQKLVARLGKIEKKITVHTTDGLLVEIVAIGQALGKSEDAHSFTEHVDATFA